MYTIRMKLGFLGLGKMGSGMVEKLLFDGHSVVVWNRSPEPVSQLQEKIDGNNLAKQHLTVVSSIQEVCTALEAPRIIWSMLPSGQVTETVLKEIAASSVPGDIVIDGSNAYYKDTQRRFEAFKEKSVKFLGIGVAGGIIGPKEGYDMMAGGDKEAYTSIVPILDSLVKPHAAHGYFGEGGAGHFVKMIHNGIEYGIMQSLAEGFDVLEHAPYPLDLVQVGKVWQKSSLVSGFMLDRAVEVLEKDPHLNGISGLINFTGEGEWTINQAREEGINVEIIEHSFDYRKRTHTDPKLENSFTARMVAALRNAFGGHEVKKK